MLLAPLIAVLISSCATQDNSPGGGGGTTSAPTGSTGTAIDGQVRASSTRHLNNLSSANVPGTNHGRLACAWAVNRVVKDGTGKEVGGDLSTANMGSVLAHGRGRAVAPETAPEGSVIISPTSGPRTGHVGILMRGSGDSRRIYSNSSNQALYMDNFTVAKWRNYYGGELGLPVRAYQLNP
jgi:hypothetical protein